MTAKYVPKFEDFRGRKEAQDLEFKGREAVDDVRILPRAVCAMLNSGGGAIVVGLEDDGKTLQKIEDVELACSRVRDRLPSSISPPPPPGLRVEPFADVPAIWIEVPAGEPDRLYAARSTEGRFSVPERSGDRVRPLDWLDIVERIRSSRSVRGSNSGSTREQARELLNGWIKVAEKDAPDLESQGGLFLVLRADGPTGDYDSDRLRDLLEQALSRPENLGIRRDGWHFSALDTPIRDERRLKRRREWVSAGDVKQVYRRLEVSSEAPFRLRFATRIDASMLYGRTFDEVTMSNTLHPYALSETVSSVCQLFDWLRDGLNRPPADVWAGFLITQLRGRRIRPYKPGTGGFEFHGHWTPPMEDEEPGPILRSLDGAIFHQHPHKLARLLLGDLYRDFGYRDDAVPFWDPNQERFVYG